MKGMKLYEYAVIRIVPRVEREEFVNAGVILFCKESSFLEMKYRFPGELIFLMDPLFDMNQLTRAVEGFTGVCYGTSRTSLIARLGKPERFRWLTAKRSTIIQTSAVHSGFATNLNRELDELFTQFVI